jgi:hypothetical protein
MSEAPLGVALDLRDYQHVTRARLGTDRMESAALCGEILNFVPLTLRHRRAAPERRKLHL